ncbi:MAG: gas vesicle protein [Myxococcota bacterium]
MSRTRARPAPLPLDANMEVLEQADHSLLEVVDHLLNKGVVLKGELVLGVADVDLVYIQLTALLCAADRVLAPRKKPAP